MQHKPMNTDNPTGAAAFESLLLRLQQQHRFTRVTDAHGLADFAAHGSSVLLLTEQPGVCPEAWDLAVVLPELMTTFGTRLRAGFAAPAESASIAQRFGVGRFPALLFQRDGEYIGALEGMRDWASFGSAFERMLEQPASRAPGIGIPVRTAMSSSCH